MWPWAAVYSAQVVIAMVVFNLIEGPAGEGRGGGVIGAIVTGAVFMLPTVALWRARELFTNA